MINPVLVKFIHVAIGGAIGATARYGVSELVQMRTRGSFPWGTMAVNVIGCLLMGTLAPVLMEKLRPEHRLLILTGMFGAFTTWSSFGYEAISMLNQGQFRNAVIYVLATNVVCLLAVLIGYRLIEKTLLAG
jgi:CrcB protein